jgi:hypothetical protein
MRPQPGSGEASVKRTLYATVKVRRDTRGRTVVAAVLRWAEECAPHDTGGVSRLGLGRPRTVARRLREGDPVPPAYRGVLLALWTGRRLGARAIRLWLDDADVIAQIQGATQPSPAALGAYLQVRALLNAFREVSIEERPGISHPTATLVTSRPAEPPEPRRHHTACTDLLPLWATAV